MPTTRVLLVCDYITAAFGGEVVRRSTTQRRRSSGKLRTVCVRAWCELTRRVHDTSRIVCGAMMGARRPTFAVRARQSRKVNIGARTANQLWRCALLLLLLLLCVYVCVCAGPGARVCRWCDMVKRS